jgi:hypothetical protein
VDKDGLFLLCLIGSQTLLSRVEPCLDRGLCGWMHLHDGAEDCLAKAEPLSKRGFSFGTDRAGRVRNGPIGGRCQENPSAITQRS